MINILKLYQDRGISFQLPGHKHVSAGWVGTPCPFCTGNPGYHLGYCTDPSSQYAGKFVCYRCGGGKRFIPTLSSLLGINEAEALQIATEYHMEGSPTVTPRRERILAPRCLLPIGTESMGKRHKNYLSSRNFDPDYLEREWGLQGTGPTGAYKQRIIIPIEYQGKLVTYQGRDITDKSKMKYKACLPTDEARPIKHCLYGIDKVDPKRGCVVVEGVADVWRLGPGAVAVFGVKYEEAQVRLLAKFRRVFILFDSEERDPQAGEQARKLRGELSILGVDVYNIDLEEGDPGDMKDNDARALMRDLKL